ncbi:MAG: hypothetical protein QM498_15915, partial [Desulfobacterium sp.]
RAMGPARNRRRPNWPVPIAHRGGSAELARKFYFLIKPTCPDGHNEDRKSSCWQNPAPSTCFFI